MTFPEPQGFTAADIQRQVEAAVEAALSARDEQHKAEMDSLRAALVGPGVVTFVPEHAGGPGTEIKPTWSLAEQEAARAAARA